MDDQYIQSDIFESTSSQYFDYPVDQFLLNEIDEEIFENRKSFHDNLSELIYLQNGFNINELFKWRSTLSVELAQALNSAYLDDTDYEEIEGFLYNRIVADDFYSDCHVDYEAFINPEDENEDFEEYCERMMSIGNPMQVALIENQIISKVENLKRQGFWSSQDPDQNSSDKPSLSVLTTQLDASFMSHLPKTHHKYLQAEIKWLADDVLRERNWKKNAARRLAIAASKAYQERLLKAAKEKREEELKVRKQCAHIAKMVRDWWRQMDKIVHAKHQVRLAAKRQQAMSSHLGRVLETTEEYTKWLTEGIANQAPLALPSTTGNKVDDKLDDPQVVVVSENEVDKEEGNKDKSPLSSTSKKEETENLSDDYSAKEDSSDDEETMAEQEEFEKKENEENNKNEVKDLEDEANLPIEQLIAKYSSAYATEPENMNGESAESSSDESNDSCLKASTDQKSPEVKTEEKVEQETKESHGNKELDSLAAAAMELQPVGEDKLENDKEKGITTPFLLHGTLREYQKVGLNWLAAIYEKRLNGILADEMGLGKTIQTISLLAHLACDLGIWGPHLIIVPTSVLLNWEMEFKKWCPSFKILTYYGSLKERKEKRKGWTKTNAFHVCITSYRLSIQDSTIFKRKKWRYLILDEAQNIKNFKSQRWQTLLNINSQRRLLLTGTPLQNSLMELWSLMHFLMPNIFQSHKEFQEWFASPLTGMIEGNNELNDQLIQRLHRVLRPFLLRRLKADVEKQMPKKYEHVIMCRLSRRQRYLYDDYMSLRETRETLSSGQFLSVMNILMQLRKVCNHPDLFETRPITTPFFMERDLVEYSIPKLISQFCYSKLVAIPNYHGAGSYSHNMDEDFINPTAAAFRLLGLSKNICEMARDEPSYLSDRIYQGGVFNTSSLRVQKENLEKVDYIEVDDYVLKDRRNLLPIKKLMKKIFKSREGNQKMLSVFLPRQEVIRLNEETEFQEMAHNKPIQTNLRLKSLNMNSLEILSVDPILDSQNQGLPKSQLYVRMKARIDRLELISRISERRCQGYSNLSKKSIGDTLGGYSWGSDYSIGPDSCFFLTRSLNKSKINPNKTSDGNQIHRSYPFAQLTIKRCLFWTPFKYSIEYPLSSIEKSSRFYETVCTDNSNEFYGGLHPVNPIGNEALCSEKCSWKQELSILRSMLLSPSDVLKDLNEVLKRFTLYVPPVMAYGVKVICNNSFYYREVDQQENNIENILQPVLPRISDSNQKNRMLKKFNPYSYIVPRQFYSINMQRFLQFPDPRLIQYDCGKLQRLDMLLRQLKKDSHRVLIFTQMSRMLDILEQFLAYHGHSYLRLDGTTKVEQRQILMERFNRDTRIFVFILSTRSGGLGINLTGADTVIFYDSDWNPTMDAQAQDRCHRIGQTRDVHIYRLISEMTIEENILRKANQKRLLSDLAIEQGKFTTAFFKQNTIQELFAEPSGLEDVVEADKTRKECINNSAKTEEEVTTPTSYNISNIDSEALTAALEACEDEDDRIAEKRAIAEEKDNLDEFDEAAAIIDENTGQVIEEDPLTKFAMTRTKNKTCEVGVEEEIADPELAVERELQEFESQLTPIERYGVSYSGFDRNDSLSTELCLVDAEMEESKKNWALDQMKALREMDEEKAELEEDDILYCYGVYDPAERIAELKKLDLELQREAELDEEEETENVGIPARGRGRGRHPTRGRRKQLSNKLEVEPINSETNKNEELLSDEFLSDDEELFDMHKKNKKIRSKISYSSVADLDVTQFVNKNKNLRKIKPNNYQEEEDVDEFDQTPDIEDFFPQLSSGRGGKRTSFPVSRRRKSDHEKYGGSYGNIEDEFFYYGYQFKKSKSRNRPMEIDDQILEEEDRLNLDFVDQSAKRNQRKRPLYSSSYSYQFQKRPRGNVQSNMFPTSNLRTPNTTSPRFYFNQNNIQNSKLNTNKNILARVPQIVPALSCVPKNKDNFIKPLSPQKPISIQHLPVRRLTQTTNTNMKLPINQVFNQNGQPVFVITRELKTSNGQVLQQKFTHPVAPIPSLVGAVDMMHKALANSRREFPKIQKFVKVTSQMDVSNDEKANSEVSSLDKHSITPKIPAKITPHPIPKPNIIHLAPNKQLTVFNLSKPETTGEVKKLIPSISRNAHIPSIMNQLPTPTGPLKPIVISKPSGLGSSNFNHSGIKFIRVLKNNPTKPSMENTQPAIGMSQGKLVPTNLANKMMFIKKSNQNQEKSPINGSN